MRSRCRGRNTQRYLCVVTRGDRREAPSPYQSSLTRRPVTAVPRSNRARYRRDNDRRRRTPTPRTVDRRSAVGHRRRTNTLPAVAARPNGRRLAHQSIAYVRSVTTVALSVRARAPVRPLKFHIIKIRSQFERVCVRVRECSPAAVRFARTRSRYRASSSRLRVFRGVHVPVRRQNVLVFRYLGNGLDRASLRRDAGRFSRPPVTALIPANPLNSSASPRPPSYYRYPCVRTDRVQDRSSRRQSRGPQAPSRIDRAGDAAEP